ncbi:hypothetical protein HQ403_00555 [Candidatus Kaiserbacteria bacterium]|nr:hypothetical protein [Candidatus Kaiserbacteria bacterium]
MIFTILALMFTTSVIPTQVGAATLEGVTRTPAYVEQYVRIYFSDIPIMTEIAECESRFRQFDIDGDVLRGEKNRRDVGVMQINEDFHLDTALEKELNLYTLEGNLAYARALYEKMGTKPWKHSKKCWGGMVLALAK